MRFLQGLTSHDLRHTAASLAIASGASVKAIQRMLGHKDAAVTLNIYSPVCSSTTWTRSPTGWTRPFLQPMPPIR